MGAYQKISICRSWCFFPPLFQERPWNSQLNEIETIKPPKIAPK